MISSLPVYYFALFSVLLFFLSFSVSFFLETQKRYHVYRLNRGYLLFFEVNTKSISSRVLKTSEFTRVRSTRVNSDVFNSRDEIHSVAISEFPKWQTLFHLQNN